MSDKVISKEEAIKHLNLINKEYGGMMEITYHINCALQYINQSPLDSDVEEAIDMLYNNRLAFGFESSGEKNDITNWFNTIKQALRDKEKEISDREETEQSFMKWVDKLQSKLDKINHYIRTELCCGIVYDKIKQILKEDSHEK